jgi:hypothetical protein
MAARLGTLAVVLLSIVRISAGSVAQTEDKPARVSRWPCRLIVKPTLLGVIEDGWERSPTLRRQCDELASARAVVALEWGAADSDSHARTRWGVQEGVVVARAAIPPVGNAIELVAHELQHVLEKVRGLDFEAEARRPGSGVWRAVGGYETQAAIDVGRQVAKEVRDARRGQR